MSFDAPGLEADEGDAFGLERFVEVVAQHGLELFGLLGRERVVKLGQVLGARVVELEELIAQGVLEALEIARSRINLPGHRPASLHEDHGIRDLDHGFVMQASDFRIVGDGLDRARRHSPGRHEGNRAADGPDARVGNLDHSTGLIPGHDQLPVVVLGRSGERFDDKCPYHADDETAR